MMLLPSGGDNSLSRQERAGMRAVLNQAFVVCGAPLFGLPIKSGRELRVLETLTMSDGVKAPPMYKVAISPNFQPPMT
jgi:hypothetical protein